MSVGKSFIEMTDCFVGPIYLCELQGITKALFRCKSGRLLERQDRFVLIDSYFSEQIVGLLKEVL